MKGYAYTIAAALVFGLVGCSDDDPAEGTEDAGADVIVVPEIDGGAEDVGLMTGDTGATVEDATGGDTGGGDTGGGDTGGDDTGGGDTGGGGMDAAVDMAPRVCTQDEADAIAGTIAGCRMDFTYMLSCNTQNSDDIVACYDAIQATNGGVGCDGLDRPECDPF